MEQGAHHPAIMSDAEENARQDEEALMLPPSQLYQYRLLNRDFEEIRLLELERDSSDDSMRGRLQSYLLEDCPQYYAISYEWGSDKTEHSILVNGGLVRIRSNLLSFLRCFSAVLPNDDQRGIKYYLWADQICINQ
jgi:hypothetical protein